MVMLEMEPVDGGVCLGVIERVLSLEDAATIPATTHQMSKDLTLLAEKAALVERTMRLALKQMGGGSTRRLALAQRGESDEDKDELAFFRGRVKEGHGGVVLSKEGGFLVSGNEMAIKQTRSGGVLRPVGSKTKMKMKMRAAPEETTSEQQFPSSATGYGPSSMNKQGQGQG